MRPTPAGRARARQLIEEHMAKRWIKTQADLARETRLDPGTVGDFLNGERWPNRSTRTELENFFGLPGGTLQMLATEEITTFGLTPPEDPIDPRVEKLIELFTVATDDELIEELARRRVHKTV